MSAATCPCCGCTAPGGTRVHAIAAALRDDDLDGAMTLGLLEVGPPRECARCTPACRAQVETARTARLRALDARERHRARAQRLERRERERVERRRPAPAADAPAASAGTPPAALPPAAAAALARARARAATPRG